MYKLGIIGIGQISTRYIQAVQKINGIEIKVIADIDQEKLIAYKNIYDLEICNPNDIFSYNLDGILITTPNVFHAKYAKMALEASMDAICEKPLTISIDDLNELINIAKASSNMLYMALHCRYRPEVQFALYHLNEEVERFEQYYCENWTNAPQWYYSPEMCGGGVLLDVGINQIDWLLKFLDNLSVKSAMIQKYEYKVDINAHISWEYLNGHGQTFLSWKSEKEKKVTYLYTKRKNEYILDHQEHVVKKNNRIIYKQECDEYLGVLLDFLTKKKLGKKYPEDDILKLYSILRYSYKLCGEDFLSSKYNSIGRDISDRKNF